MNHKKKQIDNLFTRLDLAIITILLIVGLSLRLYKIGSPLADWHSWRQSDTAAVARNFVKGEFNLLYPKFDDLSNSQSGLLNPEGYRFVEFPIYNAIFALFYKTMPLIPLEVYGRLISIFSSLFLIITIYYLALKEEGRIAAFFSSLTFSIFPFFVYYSRTVLPDMMATSSIFLAILFIYFWTHERRKIPGLFTFCFAIFFAAAAFLIKPTTIFFLLPIIYLFFQRFSLDFIKKYSFYFFIFAALLPLLLWRIWISTHPEGIPVSHWLITSVHTSEGPQNIMFRPAFFRWIFYERISNLILGGYLLVFFIIGILKKPKKSLLIISTGLASLIYLLTFQGGNVQHDYYQILILPALALMIGTGVEFVLIETKRFSSQFLNWIVVIAIFLFSFYFSYFQVKNYYSYSNDLINISKIINTITPADSRVVTDTTGDTTLLYLSDRKGYPLVSEDLSLLKKQGMNYFVTMKKEVAENVKKEYSLIFESDKVYIFKL